MKDITVKNCNKTQESCDKSHTVAGRSRPTSAALKHAIDKSIKKKQRDIKNSR